MTPVASQALRFGFVGVTNTLITWALYGLLIYGAAFDAAPANAIGWTAGIAWSFFWNRRWTFAAHLSERAVSHQLARFLSVNLLCLALSTGIVWMLAERLGVWPVQFLATAVTFAVGFLLNRLWVFSDPQSRSPVL